MSSLFFFFKDPKGRCSKDHHKHQETESGTLDKSFVGKLSEQERAGIGTKAAARPSSHSRPSHKEETPPPVYFTPVPLKLNHPERHSLLQIVKGCFQVWLHLNEDTCYLLIRQTLIFKFHFRRL